MKEKKVFIIAELSANHGGKIEVAIDSIRAAKRTGADAVKLQTYTPDTITIDSDNEDFLIKGGTLWDDRKLYDLYKEGTLPWEWHAELFKIAKEEGLICFSSPFDKTAVDLLEELNCPIYKIASLEITDIPLIEYIAKTKKPLILSTGIANYEDIKLAIDACKAQGNHDITVLKCTTAVSYTHLLNSLVLSFACANPDIDKVLIGVDSKENLIENFNNIDDETLNKLMSQSGILKQENENILLPFNWPK